MEQEKEYLLQCDFGSDVTSPIPSVEPVHENASALVPAVVGTTVKLFPGKRDETAEFLSYITGEDGQITGVRCCIREASGIYKFLGLPEPPGWEVDLICGKKVYVENSRYENGRNTHTYRSLILLEKE